MGGELDAKDRVLIIDRNGRYRGELYVASESEVLSLEFDGLLSSVRFFKRTEVPRSGRSSIWLYVEM